MSDATLVSILSFLIPFVYALGWIHGARSAIRRRPTVGERLLADSLVVSAGNVEPMHDPKQRPRFRSIRGGAA